MQLNILYHGLSCFTIEAKQANKASTIVFSPYETKGTGLRLPRTMEANVLAISQNSTLYNNVGAVSKPELIITEPGEYEKGGVFVYGILAKKEDTKNESLIFRCEFGEITLAHLGALDHKLTDEELSELENIDILMLPVGGGDVVDCKKAIDIANQVQPRIIIPMHYKMPGLSVKLDGAEKFVKEYGAKEETTNKLKIAKKDLPQEDTRVVVMEKG